MNPWAAPEPRGTAFGEAETYSETPYATTYPSDAFSAGEYVGGGAPGVGSAGTSVAPARLRERSLLGLITLLVAVVWVGVAMLLNALGLGLSFVAVTAVALAILAIGLLVGAFRGRARWLTLLALPLSAVLWLASALPANLDSTVLSEGVGGAQLTPAEVVDGQLQFGVGQATLNVGDWSPAVSQGESIDIAVEVGMGELVIEVPQNWRVDFSGEVGLGEILVDGADVAGGSGSSYATILNPQTDGPTMALDAEVGMGLLRVVSVPASVAPPISTGSTDTEQPADSDQRSNR